MTRDDIIRMAKESMVQDFSTSQSRWFSMESKALERFFHAAYAAGAAAEQEKVARWMIRNSYATGHGDTIEDLLEEMEWQVAERERKACIRACEEDAFEDQFDGLGEAVQRIQARGET